MVKLTVNGRSVELKDGASLLDAASAAGVHIDTLCYHPCLPARAVCRMCLVDVEGQGRPLPACVTPTKDGDVVETDTQSLQDARTMNGQWPLARHPNDCMRCEVNGSCRLQNLVNENQWAESWPRIPLGPAACPAHVLSDHASPSIWRDVSKCIECGADLTIMEEGAELLARLKEGRRLPIFTSCCPGWVNWVEINRPDILPHLSTTKSPQQMHGALTKRGRFAHKLGAQFAQGLAEPYVVSVMPCTAKKDEAVRPGMSGDLDHVLTTRELARMIRARGMGGCLGGGGEPKSMDPKILEERMHAIYAIDQRAPHRRSHENEEVQKLYADELSEPSSLAALALLHTSFAARGSRRLLLMRLLDAVDRRDAEGVASLFHPDALWSTGSSFGDEALVATRLPPRGYGPLYARHRMASAADADDLTVITPQGERCAFEMEVGTVVQDGRTTSVIRSLARQGRDHG
ncbi:[Fe-Fe] hydrogenase large subunit C-terminal domain-containing protein [Aquabacterium sp. CECT 9606]|uniref:[Fe-Fe] hydrogenase large subunit C-terminal domain-containing protein n=1 Tax=Aquabacterium sp. CECT 9606 TaxID=2845822 RepID=UPI001E618A07|nr:[Fe-Fe] hydrogenase large subunit C-terminal domain-containing protein [Aquabacterium sp. CECT 9606]